MKLNSSNKHFLRPRGHTEEQYNTVTFNLEHSDVHQQKLVTRFFCKMLIEESPHC